MAPMIPPFPTQRGSAPGCRGLRPCGPSPVLVAPLFSFLIHRAQTSIPPQTYRTASPLPLQDHRLRDPLHAQLADVIHERPGTTSGKRGVCSETPGHSLYWAPPRGIFARHPHMQACVPGFDYLPVRSCTSLPLRQPGPRLNLPALTTMESIAAPKTWYTSAATLLRVEPSPEPVNAYATILAYPAFLLCQVFLNGGTAYQCLISLARKPPNAYAASPQDQSRAQRDGPMGRFLQGVETLIKTKGAFKTEGSIGTVLKNANGKPTNERRNTQRGGSATLYQLP